MEGSRDALKDISFDGCPSGYRDFRRKTLLAIAGLEDKHAHLAGPRLLTRLSGEAWRATEHLSISQLRSPEGFLTVIKALDEHYKFLPETELHESIDEFLFALKRRNGEGATAFASRFRTQLSRVENLICQERELTRAKRRRTTEPTKPPVDEQQESEMEETDRSEAESQARAAPGSVHSAPAAAGTVPAPAGDAPPTGGVPTSSAAGAHAAEAERAETVSARSQASKASTGRRGKQDSRGTYEQDWAASQLRMKQMLGTLELGHLKPKPIFPQSVLGHLFMRKYGLSREQRAQVVRSTNGSSRFVDIERILRASDFEESSKHSDRRPAKPPRRDAYAVQDQVYAAELSDSSSVGLMDTDDSAGSDHALAVEPEQTSDEDVQHEIEEIYEIQRKAKDKFKKSYRNYKDAKKRVRELKRGRQPYYPVVALNQPADASTASSSQPAQVPLQKSTFKYDKKPQNKNVSKGKKEGSRPFKREDAHVAEATMLTSFNYMIEEVATCSSSPQAEVPMSPEEVLLASVPEGHAILDTGCTTSVVGSETAYRLAPFLGSQDLPPPEECELPPVELKGFKGEKVQTTKGLRWNVKLGDRWGTVTTYVIPGQTPFLISRRVLEGMQACLDLGRKTITSVPHNMHGVPLKQASNGHFVLPLFDESKRRDVVPTQPNVNEPNDDDSDESVLEVSPPMPPPEHQPKDHGSTKVQFLESAAAKSPQKGKMGTKQNSKHDNGPPSTVDRRRAFQHIAKNTKHGVVEISNFQSELNMLFGSVSGEITHAHVAYRPKLERVPAEASQHEMFQSKVTLSKDGHFSVEPWSIRPAGSFRSQVDPVSIALFVHRPVNHHDMEPKHDSNVAVGHRCYCCCEDIPESEMSTYENNGELEMLYEQTDWTHVKTDPIPSDVREKLLDAISSLRKTQTQLVLARILEEPDQVRAELQEWLGPQGRHLEKGVQFLEVFTGKAPLAARVEQKLGIPSIKIGYQYGHDLDNLADRRKLMTLIAFLRPRHIWFSFPCTCWGPWSRFNLAKGGSCAEKILVQRAKARRHLHAVTEAWSIQVVLGGHCHAENPLTSEAWNELNLGEVYDVRTDQCALGLRCPKTRNPVLKPTRIVTTQQEMAEIMQTHRCDGRHQHAHLAGTYKGINLSKIAETYPTKFCNIVSTAIAQDVEHVQLPSASATDHFAVAEVLASSDMPVEAPESGPSDDKPVDSEEETAARARQIVTKLHINTGHATPEQMMRLANRCRSSESIKRAIRQFECSVCKELKLPTLRRNAAMPHAEQPNHVVGVDYVQVELTRDEENADPRRQRGAGMEETKFNVLTCVDLGTDFATQIIAPTTGKNILSNAFHKAWARPYGAPKVVYMDPQQVNLSKDFQDYLSHHGIQLLHCAADSHWQLGRLEIANRVLRDMARRAWRTTTRPAEEVIETCASVRNQFLRKSGFSPAKWFLGQDPKHAGWLVDVDAQHDAAVQSQILADPNFQAKMSLREEAARAFHEAHAKDVWRRAIAARNRPLRGPYQSGQLVYIFRRKGKGQLTTRNGYWCGPGRVIGTESSTGHFVPRVIWVAWNGYLYKCSPEGLRPVPEDEAEFRKLARQLAEGRLHPDVEATEQTLADRSGQFYDLTEERPRDDDYELKDDVDDEPMSDDDLGDDDDDDRPPKPKSRKRPTLDDPEGLPAPRAVRMRFYRSPEYWGKRARGAPPLGPIQEGVKPDIIKELPTSSIEPPSHRRRVENAEVPTIPEEEAYEPTTPANSPRQEDIEIPDVDDVSMNVGPPTELSQEVPPPVSDAAETPNAAEGAAPAVPHEVPVPDDDTGLLVDSSQSEVRNEHVLEISLDVLATDVVDNPLFLWGILDECLVAAPSQAKQRRVEVNFKKLNPQDKKLFEGAMHKEWNSWVENKVTSICSSRGIPPERIIKARWVLVWKKSSDPDDRSRTPKARLVLVGWQDPELGKIATDSPTLRKESKGLVLSICASKHWKLWGADIKTAFLSGDPTSRDIYFKPPADIRQWMQLDDSSLMKLEKAAYGLAEAPRAWFLRLTREMKAAGLSQSSLDPCLFCLRCQKTGELLGVCGIHVDDLLGGGSPAMDKVLEKLKAKLPFGDYRTYTIRYTGVEIRQDPTNFSIEVGQETYIDSLQPVETKPLGTASTPLKNASILRQCAGQLAWVANSTRPDQAFLSSYLQGMQDKGCVSHVQLFNKAIREMKERRICLRYPSEVPIDSWRIMAVADAGWGTRGNGESQGGYVLCLCNSPMLEQKPATCWIVDWSSKKLRRAVRSSVAAETLAGQNGLDAIEMFQALIEETLRGITPKQFRQQKPQHPAGLVVDSKGFYDAVTRSCCSQSISLERRLQIDYAIAKETMSNQNILIFWINNLRMIADVLTKLKGDSKPLYDLLESWKYHIKPCVESGRKEKARGSQNETPVHH